MSRVSPAGCVGTDRATPFSLPPTCHALLSSPTSPPCRDVSKPTKVLVTLGMLAFTVWILFNFCGDTILSRKRLESGMD